MRPRPVAVGAWRGAVWAVVLAGLVAAVDALTALDVKGGGVVFVAVAAAVVRTLEGYGDDRREAAATGRRHAKKSRGRAS